jgi:type II secretory pathway component PulF
MLKKQINNLLNKPFIMTHLATILIIIVFIILLFTLLNSLYLKKEKRKIKDMLYKIPLFRKLF